MLSGMTDNLYLPLETIANYRSDCPAGQEDFFLYGRWRMPEHAIYARFASDVHVVSDELKPNTITHASFDFGDRSHILVGQTYFDNREKRLLVGEEIHLEGVDTPGQARALKDLAARRGLVFGQGSTFNVDPTAKIEQIKPVRDAFPGVRVVQTQRGNAYFEIDDGIRCVQRALMDSTGVIRVRLSRSLMGRKYGVVDGIQSYKRNPQTQVPVRDNLRDEQVQANGGSTTVESYSAYYFNDKGEDIYRIVVVQDSAIIEEYDYKYTAENYKVSTAKFNELKKKHLKHS
jgi:hypothetical protein